MATKYLKARQFAETYSIAVTTVYAMCAGGRLPHIRLGTGRGTIRIPTDALDQVVAADVAIQDHPVAPAAQPKPAKPAKPALKHMKIGTGRSSG